MHTDVKVLDSSAIYLRQSVEMIKIGKYGMQLRHQKSRLFLMITNNVFIVKRILESSFT